MNEQELKEMELKNRELYLKLDFRLMNLFISIIDSVENKFTKKKLQIGIKNLTINKGE